MTILDLVAMACVHISLWSAGLRSLYIPTYVYHYTKETFVRPSVTYEREVSGGHSTRAQKFSFLGIAGLWRQPNDTVGYGPSSD
jgi:hypothetical protein